MKFYSANNKRLRVSFHKAVLGGLAPDGGLFMPARIPKLPANLLKNLDKMTFQEMSYEIAKIIFKNDVPARVLKKLVNRAFTFDAPLIRLEARLNVLELFHGPTLAFKDFAARFMAQIMFHLAKQSNKKLTILAATSGDTGSAVASSFYKVPGARVIILYPSKKVSLLQEKQLTALGLNITALEIQGNFDDCQRLTKQAFGDKEINRRLNLVSANSINIARLFPQAFYYFYGWSRLQDKKTPVAVSVPSGNFGNLTAGLLAKKMGLPIFKFIASTNVNDSVLRYLKAGVFKPQKTKATVSNAMDVGNPSNFARLLALYDNKRQAIKKDVVAFSFTDKQTLSALKEVHKKYNYIPDPHGAVAYLGLKKYLECNPKTNGIFLETAHPAKFLDIVEKTIGSPPKIPSRLKKCLKGRKRAILLSSAFPDFKKFLLNLK